MAGRCELADDLAELRAGAVVVVDFDDPAFAGATAVGVVREVPAVASAGAELAAVLDVACAASNAMPPVSPTKPARVSAAVALRARLAGWRRFRRTGARRSDAGGGFMDPRMRNPGETSL